jgi:uncharacterized protein (TIGR03000 family)
MLRHRFSLMTLAVAALAALLTPRPANAQYPVGDRSAQMTLGRPYYESRGPGYSAYVPSATFAGRYDFYPGKYTGYPIVSRFATTNGYYATLPSGYSPIMFTSLNYPEVYGAYILGPGVSVNVAPPIQTRPDNPPSDNPVGAPYLPLSRPLAEVPEKGVTQLNTVALTSGRPALIDVFLPEKATLSFQGVAMDEEGAVRAFQSPPLVPGRTYTYDVRASWRGDDGREVVRNRKVTVRAGDHLEVDLNRSVMPRAEEPENQQPMLRTRPAPMTREPQRAPQQ